MGIEHTKAWKARNPERVKEQRLRYAEKHREREAERLKEWAKANPDKKRTAYAKWRAENPEHKKAYQAAYQAANLDKHRINQQTRRARKKAVGGVLSADILQRLYSIQKGLCACCRKPLGSDYHLDHIMPIALGGTNTDDNVQLLTARCNSSKHSRHPVDYMQSKGFLL